MNIQHDFTRLKAGEAAFCRLLYGEQLIVLCKVSGQNVNIKYLVVNIKI